MAAPEKPYEPSAGVLAALAGVFFTAVGGYTLTNVNEDPGVFLPLALALLACAFYFLLTAAIARGVQLARLARRD